MIIDAVSDLHGFYPSLEEGDLLIVAGDITAQDNSFEYDEFLLWLNKQKYRKKILVAGNHDMLIEKIGMPPESLPDNTEYLQDSGTEFEGLLIWGSPWTPWFRKVNPKCTAFMKRDKELFDYWEKIPKKVDILVTHGPAYGILDGIPLPWDGALYHAGSESLHGWLKYVERPRYHIFGHIHEAYGVEEYFCTYDDNMMQSINCSHVNEKYKPVNKPQRIFYEK